MKTSLSIVVSLVLLCAALLTSVLIYLQEMRSSRETIQQESLVRLNVLATELQNVLFDRISEGNRADALMSLSVTAMTPGVRAVLLTDGEDRVLLASRYAWIGENATGVSAFDPEIAAGVLRSGTSLVASTPGSETLRAGYYPLVIGYNKSATVKRYGALFIEYDSRSALATARYTAARHAMTYIGITVASTLAIGVLLHLLIARRVARIAAASVRLAAGDLDVRTGLTGRDEISQLGSAFDRMVERMSDDAVRRKAAEDQIRHLAFFDPLTHLPNRRFLTERLGQALAASEAGQQYGALFMLDLDHFKRLNDTKGHAVGDRLLVEVAGRLKATVRHNDTVSRLGGDEFVVIVESLGHDEAPAAAAGEQVARKIHEALARPFDLGDADYHGTPSIGLTLFRGRETPIDTLLKQADVAMYQAKDAGRNAIRLFSLAAQEAIESRIATEAALRRALAQQELRLYYQPQVDARERRIGAEALIRWHDPARGIVPPGAFIPIAEESALILDIGNWVIETACAQLKRWEADPATRDLQLAVNVSARQFHDPNFVARVRRSIAGHRVDPRRINFELTESLVLEDVDGVISRMEELRRVGVCFSLDDFGTGYSSLAYLKRLPLEQVKIDQSFVRDVAHDPDDRVIVQAILAIGRSMRLQVIAEGVETEAQHRILLDEGCEAFQGYLFGRPVPIEDWG